jgi:hypothetical protein
MIDALSHPHRWPCLFLGCLCAAVVVAFAADAIHAQTHGSDIVVVPAAVPREVLEASAPEPGLSALPTPHAQTAITVEVVKPTWWDQLWAILLPLMAAGGTYLGIWLWVQGRKLLAAQVVRVEERKVEAELAHDTNERIKDIGGKS